MMNDKLRIPTVILLAFMLIVERSDSVTCTVTPRPVLQGLGPCTGDTEDTFGSSTALSEDGSIMAIVGKGYYQVKEYNYSSNEWANESPRSITNFFDTKAIALSKDGKMLAVSKPSSPQIVLYQFNGTKWKYWDIIGIEAVSETGVAVSSVGDALEFSGESTVLAASSTWAEEVRVFDLSGGIGAIKQKGITLERDFNMTFFGDSLALSDDGNTVAVGAPGHSESLGYVQVFDFDNGKWMQKGQTLNNCDFCHTREQFWEYSGRYFGEGVSLSADGLTLAASEPYDHQGKVHVYKYNGSHWNDTIWGEPDARMGNFGEFLGDTIALSGDASILVASAIYNVSFHRATNNGYVQFADETTYKAHNYDNAVSISRDGSTVAPGGSVFDIESDGS